jgi:hypothetical protein
MLYIESPSFLRKNRTNNTRKDYIISIAYQDTRQSLISRRREKDSRRSIILILQHEY